MSGEWPKRVPLLSPELLEKQRLWHAFWLEHYPVRFSFVSRFTENFLRAVGPTGTPERVLELGPGPTSAMRKLMRPGDEYACCEQDPDFSAKLERMLPNAEVVCADVERGLPFGDARYDRVVAAHLLEHLPNLPAALGEVARVLRNDGAFDVVIPCEGSPLNSIGRMLSSARTFKKRFGRGFHEIMRSEHVNTAAEILAELRRTFVVEQERYFPVPSKRIAESWNLLAGLRLRKHSSL